MYPILDTRVECKFSSIIIDLIEISDRILPDWNVNFRVNSTSTTNGYDRILPDWNVNSPMLHYRKLLYGIEYYQIGM